MAPVTSYCNPIQVQLADPYVFIHEGTYYLYGTHDRDTTLGIPVYVSENLVTWRWGGWAFEKTGETWSQVNFWGPEVIERRGRFYMLYNASPGPEPGPPFNMHLCIAVADSPLGPFREYRAPWYQPEGPDEAIDQNLLTDDDGANYLFWTRVTHGRNQIDVVPLGESLTEFAGEPRVCITPTQPWESHAWDNHIVSEGAFIFKRGPYYYLTYTGNHFMDRHYAIGYATSTQPMGPWTKAEHNPILERTEHVAGPGNGMIVPSPDGSEKFMVYHTHQSARELGWRQIAVDRVRIEPAANGPDKLYVDGPTHTPQPLPGGAAPIPTAASGGFEHSSLDRSRWFVINEAPGRWSVEEGALRITTTPGDMWKHRGDFQNLFTQFLPTENAVITVRVRFEPQANYEQAFVCLWQDHDNFARLSVAYDEGPKFLAAWEREGAFHQTDVPNGFGGEVRLRIVKRGGVCDMLASGGGADWLTVVEGAPCDFTLPRAGLGAISPVSGATREAVFERFEVETP
jgi:beta-xylosidase